MADIPESVRALAAWLDGEPASIEGAACAAALWRYAALLSETERLRAERDEAPDWRPVMHRLGFWAEAVLLGNGDQAKARQHLHAAIIEAASMHGSEPVALRSPKEPA